MIAHTNGPVGLGACLSLCLLAATSYAAEPSFSAAISGQGHAAVNAAYELAHTIEGEVEAAASAQPGQGASVLPRARAFYDLLKAEQPDFAAKRRRGPEETLPQVRISSRGAAVAARPAGERIGSASAGSSAAVLDETDGWRKLLLEDGAVGWVRASEVSEQSSGGKPDQLVAERYEGLPATLSYPGTRSTAGAIARMARGEVSSVANRCARSMAEALGWGLGDAHEWADGLPGKGFVRRPPGEKPHPGDIVVWPFTFGARRRQHVGFAVQHQGAVTLLSNLNGRTALSPILPGYVAFAPP